MAHRIQCLKLGIVLFLEHSSKPDFNIKDFHINADVRVKIDFGRAVKWQHMRIALQLASGRYIQRCGHLQDDCTYCTVEVIYICHQVYIVSGPTRNDAIERKTAQNNLDDQDEEFVVTL